MKPSKKQQRVQNEPAFILHHYDWSESSLILDVLTRHQGRQTLIAKGVKRPTSNFKAVLLPLQPLYLDYALSLDENIEIQTLKGAIWAGGHLMPMGESLLFAYYINELLIKLLAHNDAYPILFDHYSAVVRVLSQKDNQLILEPTLRAFELILLHELGLLPSLNHQTLTLNPVLPDVHYVLLPQMGLCEAQENDQTYLVGKHWQSLQNALNQPNSLGLLLSICEQSEVNAHLKRQLRAIFHDYCGQRILRTRQLMLDFQNLLLKNK